MSRSMNKKNGFRILVLFLALGLMGPTGALAFHHGHHGHHGYHGYAPHYAYHGYHHSYYPYAYGAYGAVGLERAAVPGALDLNVKPKDTQVYLNGKYIGVTDNFDGVPRALWLKEGTYEIIFYLDGYATVVREFTIHPGVVIDVKQRMSPGASVPPEEVTSKSPAGGEPREDDGEGVLSE